jgi:hypothetical protein
MGKMGKKIVISRGTLMFSSYVGNRIMRKGDTSQGHIHFRRKSGNCKRHYPGILLGETD